MSYLVQLWKSELEKDWNWPNSCNKKRQEKKLDFNWQLYSKQNPTKSKSYVKACIKDNSNTAFF